MGGMLHPEARAAVFGQSFVVRHLRDEIGHVNAERLCQLRVRDLLVFDRVMQVAGCDEIRVRTRVG